MRQPSSPRRTLLRPLLVFGLILSLVSVLPVSAARLQAPDDGSYQAPPFNQNWTNTGLITTNDDWSGVPGIVGYLGNYDAGSPVQHLIPHHLPTHRRAHAVRQTAKGDARAEQARPG